MKQFYFFLLICSINWCCKPSGNSEKTAEDSLNYYPPTPEPMDKAEFRNYFRTLTAFFDSTLLRSGFSGQIVVAKKGTILYEKYAGYPDARKKDSMRANTPLHIASTSKTFTAVAILQLVQEGKLSLDDSLSRFFPALPYPGITVRMLLNHRSGLPNYVHFMDKTSWDTKKYCSNRDVLELLIREPPNKEASPDRKFNYCNTNYVLLALLIETISGKSYPAYMKEQLFDPLGMKDTYVFTLADTLTATASFKANGEYWRNDFLDATCGDKNIYTTARDLLKWDQALYTDQLLSNTLKSEAFTPWSHEKPSIHNYGLGFRLITLPGGKKIIYHFGRWHGNNAAFARLPDDQATIIILGNQFNRNIYNAAHKAYDLFGNYFQPSGSGEEETDNVPPSKKTRLPEKEKSAPAGSRKKR